MVSSIYHLPDHRRPTVRALRLESVSLRVHLGLGQQRRAAVGVLPRPHRPTTTSPGLSETQTQLQGGGTERGHVRVGGAGAMRRGNDARTACSAPSSARSARRSPTSRASSARRRSACACAVCACVTTHPPRPWPQLGHPAPPRRPAPFLTVERPWCGASRSPRPPPCRRCRRGHAEPGRGGSIPARP
jgi:hypothetical protein